MSSLTAEFNSPAPLIFMFDLKTLTEMNKRVAKAREEMRRKKVKPSWLLTKVTESRPSTRSATDK